MTELGVGRCGGGVAYASMKERTDVINTMHHIPSPEGGVARLFIAL